MLGILFYIKSTDLEKTKQEFKEEFDIIKMETAATNYQDGVLIFSCPFVVCI